VVIAHWFRRTAPSPRPIAPNAPLVLSGRFRSGSTLLWQMFDQDPNAVAFYEPDHDGLAAQIAHTTPMASHIGATDYWRAYRSRVPLVSKLHQPTFGNRRLWLDRDESWPALQTWLNALIAAAGAQRAVLKLNRFTLRLPWLRANLPAARIVHLRREPRQQWLSSRRHLPIERRELATELDAYDLLQWTLDLAPRLPLLAPWLDAPSYTLSYALWRLSETIAASHADLVVDLDADLLSPGVPGLERLVANHVIDSTQRASAHARIAPIANHPLPHPPEWFEAQEQMVDRAFVALGLNAAGTEPLERIARRQARAWRALGPLDLSQLIAPLLAALSASRSEQTRLLDRVRTLESERA
jgi:hypothetical protein